MERDTLSFPQIMVLLFAALMGPAAELLPGAAAQAGIAGALGVTVAVVLMAVAGLLVRLPAQDGGLAAGLVRTFGTWGGKAVLTIYIVWFELLLALRLHRSAQRLSQCGEQDGAGWFFVLVLAGLSLWMAYGHLGALGRTAQLFFVALCIAGGAVLILSLFQIETGSLLTDWAWSLEGTTEILLPGFQVLGYGVFAAFLWQSTGENRIKSWMFSLSMVWLVLVVVQMVIIGRFGPQLTMELNNTFFQLAEGIGVKGAFQRVESLVAAVWIFSDLLLLGGILWGIRRISVELCPGIPMQGVIVSATCLAIVGGIAVFGVRIPAEKVEHYLIPAGNLILGVGVPGIAGLVGRRKK